MGIPQEQLRPGDVLLYRGDAIVSRLIRFFDRAEVNHAGLYLGGGEVGEALGGGLERRSLGESVAGSERVLARRLTAPVESVDPVKVRADEYLGQHNRYGYEQIVLLALLSLSRRIKASPVVKRLVRKILDGAASAVAALGGEGKRQPMICSEFVYRCYDEALPASDDVYTLDIDLATPRTRAARALPGELPRGRGLEDGSILSMAALPAIRTRARRAAPEPVPEPLEALGAAYLADTVRVRSAERLTPADVAELAPSIEAFAEAWQAAGGVESTSGAEGPDVPARRGRDAGSAFDGLMRTAADFVTPGDLHKSTSLYELGDVKP